MKRYLPLLIIPALVLLIGATTYRSYRVGVQNVRYGGGKLPQTMISGVVRYADGFTPLNVLAFGVDNTGATDCADSLNAVIALAESYGGGTVYLPAGEYLVGSEIVSSLSFGIGDGVTLVGDGPRATRLQAGADSISVVHWASSFGGIKGVGIYGNGFTGVSGLRVTPLAEAQTDSLVHQDYNTFENMMIESCDEGIVMQCGPYVNPSVSGCYYNTFSSIFIQACTRGLWMKDGPNALSSGVNRNQFFGVRIGLQMNTGIQIDSGGTNSFFGCSVENVATGTSPNTVPTGVKILYIAPVGTRGNSNNLFYGLISENCTRDLDCRHSTTEFYGHSMVGSKITTDGAAVVPNVFLNSDYSATPISLKRQQYNKAMNDSLGGAAPEMFVKGGAVPYISGFYAPKGSLMLHTSGNLYVKAGVDSTAWNMVDAGAQLDVVADSDTISVAQASVFAIPANTGPTEILALTDGRDYQIVTLFCTSETNASWLEDAGNFTLTTDWRPTPGDGITLMKTGADEWFELSRTGRGMDVSTRTTSWEIPAYIEIVRVDTGSGNIILDLPLTTGLPLGHTVSVFKVNATATDTVRVRGYQNTESIDGSAGTAKYLTVANDRIIVQYVAAGKWAIISGKFAGTAY